LVGREVVDLVGVAGVVGGQAVAAPVGEPAEERHSLESARCRIEVVAAHYEHRVVGDRCPADAWRSERGRIGHDTILPTALPVRSTEPGKVVTEALRRVRC
jgi:hypothetical protein